MNNIEITNGLIEKWEPKIHRMLATTSIQGMHKDDLVQELRIVILKAAKKYNPNKKASFHTYLHTTMMNTLRTLIVKAQRKHIETQSMEELLDPEYNDLPSNKIQQALGIEDDSFEYFETLELIENSHLSPKEEQFILLRLEGLTMEEITEDLHESAYTIRAGLRDKVQALFNKGEEVNDYGKEGEVYRRI